MHSGYDYRDIECEETLNEPVGRKTVRRLDTGAVVKVEELNDVERQRPLAFEEEPKAGETAK
ncbi:MAG: hypothetical protein LBK60_03090 [Verrucomicrobiales bacterium]|nr:hypothetical protein [Verrucomicrobiales bacterium]